MLKRLKHQLIKHRKAIFFSALTGSIAWLAIVGTMIWRYGEVDNAVASDCIIVLGAGADENGPSPVFKERINHAIALHKKGLAKTIVFTGGFGQGQTKSDSHLAAAYAAKQGISQGQILIEEKSRTTQQNLVEALGVMRKHKLQSAIIVSDPLHIKRAMMMANDFGIKAVASPTRTSMYRSWKPQSEFLLRELYFFHHYLATGN